MTISEFVQNLWENDRTGAYSEMIDLETAKADLEMFKRQDGWDIPEDITPEAYMDEWNEHVTTLLEAQNITD